MGKNLIMFLVSIILIPLGTWLIFSEPIEYVLFGVPSLAIGAFFGLIFLTNMGKNLID